jgi:DNA-binding transcriptional LysR family regulator
MPILNYAELKTNNKRTIDMDSPLHDTQQYLDDAREALQAVARTFQAYTESERRRLLAEYDKLRFCMQHAIPDSKALAAYKQFHAAHPDLALLGELAHRMPEHFVASEASHDPVIR